MSQNPEKPKPTMWEALSSFVDKTQADYEATPEQRERKAVQDALIERNSLYHYAMTFPTEEVKATRAYKECWKKQAAATAEKKAKISDKAFLAWLDSGEAGGVFD